MCACVCVTGLYHAGWSVTVGFHLWLSLLSLLSFSPIVPVSLKDNQCQSSFFTTIRTFCCLYSGELNIGCSILVGYLGQSAWSAKRGERVKKRLDCL